jgi:hypothetical protein
LLLLFYPRPSSFIRGQKSLPVSDPATGVFDRQKQLATLATPVTLNALTVDYK